MALVGVSMLCGVVLLAMSLAGLVTRGKPMLAERSVTFRVMLDVLTVVIALSVVACVVDAVNDAQTRMLAIIAAGFCGLVVLGATLSRSRSARVEGALLLVLAALPVSLILLAVVASLCGWDGLNMHMN